MIAREAPEELFDAINSGQHDVVQRMIAGDHGLLSATRIGGRTALHQAAFCGDSALVGWLLHNGAEVNTRTEYGWTPLHYAAAPEDESAALLLIEYGAQVDAVNDDGDTPLHFAATYSKLNVAQALIARGAPTAAPNRFGQTPVDLAVSEDRQPMIEMLS